jgi:CheY-like chemotaxis protein
MVFTDIRLAGNMDGVELAQVINARLPKVAVLVTSGDPGDRLRELPGHSAYLQKPWRALEVLEVAERARLGPARAR